MKNYLSPEIDHNNLTKEVFALFGLLMYKYQCLEKSLSTLYLASTLSPQKNNRVEFDKLQSGLEKDTFGKLLNKVKDYLSSEELNNLVLIKEKRNYFTHYFFKEYADLFIDDPLKVVQVLRSEIDNYAPIFMNLIKPSQIN